MAGLAASAVWEESRAGSQPAGSFGEFADVAVSSRAPRLAVVPPTAYRAVELTSSATVDAFGSWVQITANIGTSRTLLSAHVRVLPQSDSEYEVEIGEGAAGSEAAVWRLTGSFRFDSAAGRQDGVAFPASRTLTDNARLSARVRDSLSTGQNYRVSAVWG